MTASGASVLPCPTTAATTFSSTTVSCPQTATISMKPTTSNMNLASATESPLLLMSEFSVSHEGAPNEPRVQASAVPSVPLRYLQKTQAVFPPSKGTQHGKILE